MQHLLRHSNNTKCKTTGEQVFDLWQHSVLYYIKCRYQQGEKRSAATTAWMQEVEEQLPRHASSGLAVAYQASAPTGALGDDADGRISPCPAGL
jgi:hypothetical protein